MSDLAEKARVDLVVADFAAVDAAGKSNMIGAGVAGLGFDAQQGITSRFSLWISVWVPTALTPVEVPLEVALVDGAGELVRLVGPAGDQPLRIAQMLQIEKPALQFNAMQRDHLGARAQFVLDFGNGLPIAPGGLFEWRIRLDGDESRTWSYPFAVAGPPFQPVIG